MWLHPTCQGTWGLGYFKRLTDHIQMYICVFFELRLGWLRSHSFWTKLWLTSNYFQLLAGLVQIWQIVVFSEVVLWRPRFHRFWAGVWLWSAVQLPLLRTLGVSVFVLFTFCLFLFCVGFLFCDCVRNFCSWISGCSNGYVYVLFWFCVWSGSAGSHFSASHQHLVFFSSNCFLQQQVIAR